MNDFLYEISNLSEITVENMTLSSITGKKYMPELDIPPVMHTHNFFEVFACFEGVLLVKLNNRSIVLRKNDIAIIPQNFAHTGIIDDINAKWYAFGYFITVPNKSSTSDLYKRLSSIADEDVLKIENVPLICMNISELSEKSENSFYNTPLHICSILDEICNTHHMQISDASPSNQYTEKTHPDLKITGKIDSMLNSFYSEQFTLADLSRNLFLSERQVTRIIKKFYNKTFFELLNDRRISVSEYMLLNSDMSVEKIAISVGFTSMNGFYREFKKRYNLTPSEYRKCIPKSK